MGMGTGTRSKGFFLPLTINPLYILLGLAVLVAVAGGWEAVRAYNRAITKAQALEGQVKSLKANRDSLQELFDEADEEAKRARADAEQRKRERDSARRDRDALLKGDPNAKAWNDTPIPESMRELRQRRDKGKGSVQGTNSGSIPNTCTGPNCSDKRGT